MKAVFFLFRKGQHATGMSGVQNAGELVLFPGAQLCQDFPAVGAFSAGQVR